MQPANQLLKEQLALVINPCRVLDAISAPHWRVWTLTRYWMITLQHTSAFRGLQVGFFASGRCCYRALKSLLSFGRETPGQGCDSRDCCI
jgi:hypothetical protein